MKEITNQKLAPNSPESEQMPVGKQRIFSEAEVLHAKQRLRAKLTANAPAESPYHCLLGSHIENLLAQTEDASAAMQSLADAATEGGLILDESLARQDNPLQFAMDLISSNPVAPDWVDAKRHVEIWPENPASFETIDEIVSAFRPNPR
jgi:hypothetical protein